MTTTLFAIILGGAALTVGSSDLDQAVRRYDAAQVNSDKAELQALLADDYLLVNSGGEIETKRQFIADQVEPGYKLQPFTVTHPIERRWDGGAVMGGTALLSGLSGGKPFSVCLRFADVWRRDARQWHVAYSQAARAKPEDCAGAPAK